MRQTMNAKGHPHKASQISTQSCNSYVLEHFCQ